MRAKDIAVFPWNIGSFDSWHVDCDYSFPSIRNLVFMLKRKSNARSNNDS